MPTIEGTDGVEIIEGTPDLDIIFGHGGDDIIVGESNFFDQGIGDTLFGGDGNDYVIGTIGDDHLEGGNAIGNPSPGGFYYNDLTGHAGNDSLITYAFETGSNMFTGGTGADDFWSLSAGENVILDYNSNEGDEIMVEFDDFLSAAEFQHPIHGTTLFIDGEQTDTYVVAPSEDIQGIFNEVLFV